MGLWIIRGCVEPPPSAVWRSSPSASSSSQPERPHVSHDLGSHAAYEYYAAHGFQFGAQVYQNVGPYGFVHYGDTYCGYLHAQKLILKNLWRLTLFLLIVWTLRRLPGAALKLCWGAGFFLFFAIDYGVLLDWETPFACLTIYLAALYLLQDRRDPSYGLVSTALLCLLAFVALTKHTSFILASFVALCVAADKVIRRKPVAGLLIAFAFPLFLIMHWTLARQALANFAPFVAGIVRFSSGYNEALMLQEPLLVTVLSLLVLAGFVLGSLANLIAARQPWSRALIEAALLYILWKQACVRADYYHLAVFLLALLLLVVPFLFALLPVAPAPAGTGKGARLWSSVPRWALPFIGGVAFGLFFLINPHCRCRPSRVLDTLDHNLSWLCSPRENTARMQQQLEAVQQQCVLRDTRAIVKGARIDLFGAAPGLVLLNGLNYWSRPMPVTFAAANRFLEEANARFYRDPQTAPPYVLCAFRAIDRRCPFQDDALALRALLDNYHLVHSEAGLPLLEQNAPSERRPATRTLLADVTTEFEHTISLASGSNTLVWMEATIEPFLLGRIRSFLYKPAFCWFGCHIAGNPNPQWMRFVTTLGPAGGMISPLIENNTDLARLFTGPAAGTELKKLQDFCFACLPEHKKYFRKEIRVRLYSVPGAAQPAQPSGQASQPQTH